MDKSIYSLVLNDEVVRRIDFKANQQGESRSEMVNKILAEYVGYQTPKMRFVSLFDLIDKLIGNESRMKLISENKQASFSLISSLNYKYNPRMTYFIELYEGSADNLGELKISFRTAKPELIEIINGFFNEWISLEKKYINAEYYFDDGKLKRILKKPKGETPEEIAKTVTDYVNMLDIALNKYITEYPYSVGTLERKHFINISVCQV